MSYKPVGGSARAPTSEVNLTPPTGYRWTVQQISVTSSSTTVTSARVYINGRFVCGTSSGNEDSADGNPLPITTGSVLSVRWDGGSVDAVYGVTMFVTETPV